MTEDNVIDLDRRIADDIKAKIDTAQDAVELAEYFSGPDVHRALGNLPARVANWLCGHAEKRLYDLPWPTERRAA